MEQIIQREHSIEDISQNEREFAMAQETHEPQRTTDVKIKDSEHLVSVAIDIGTTYSGYAFSLLNDFKRNPLKISANTAWNAAHCLLSKKTPTCLLLSPEKEFLAFGYDAEDQFADLSDDEKQSDYYFFKRFKMRLHGEEVRANGYFDILDDIPAAIFAPKCVHFLIERSL